MQSDLFMENITANQPSPKPLVLVIDDSKLVRVSIKRVLKNEFTILEAVDGEDGWDQLVTNNKVQVVITDAGMPKLDGFGLIERIRGSDIHHIKEIPIMMVTGAEKAQTDLREKALNLGATDFITKPFDDVQILARARTHAKLDSTQRTLEKTTHDLEENTSVDPLTQLSNQRYFLQHGGQDLAYALRHKQAVAFIGIGIDNFADIKTKYGTETWERVQIWIAKLLQPELRKEDTIARIDRGFFAIIAPSATRMDAAVLAERMRKKVAATPFSETVIALPVTISLGIATTGNNNFATVVEFLNTIKQVVNQAQRKGGNKILAAAQAAPEVEKKPRPSVETALGLLMKGDTESINPYLADLVKQILPLLEHSDKTCNWQLGEQISAIKQKLNLS